MYSTNFNADHWNMSVLNELCQFTGAMSLVPLHVNVDGKKVGSSDAKTFPVASVEKGTHALGVSAVYANGVESEQTIVQLDVTPDDSQLQAVSGVEVAPVSASAVKATWQQPLDRDVVKVQYCSGSPSSQSVTAPADNNYGLMVGAVYPSKTFRGRTGYVMKKARFYPLTDATYTIYVYKDDEIINETAVEDYTVGQWNEVELSAPIVVENGASYRLAVDCYDVVPDKPAIALDKNAPMEGYSDIYTLDGESWRSITSTTRSIDTYMSSLPSSARIMCPFIGMVTSIFCLPF